MKPLKEIGYLKVGMVLVDVKGLEATVTSLNGDPMDGFLLVELNNSPNPIIWDWDRVRDDLMVREESE